MFVEVVGDCFFKCANASERSASDAFVGDLRKETFDLIEPGGARGSEVNVISRMSGEPTLHARCFVRRIVVHDEVNLDTRLFWYGVFNEFKKLDEFLVSVFLMAFADDFPGCDIQRSK